MSRWKSRSGRAPADANAPRGIAVAAPGFEGKRVVVGPVANRQKIYAFRHRRSRRPMVEWIKALPGWSLRCAGKRTLRTGVFWTFVGRAEHVWQCACGIKGSRAG